MVNYWCIFFIKSLAYKIIIKNSIHLKSQVLSIIKFSNLGFFDNPINIIDWLKNWKFSCYKLFKNWINSG